MDVGINWCNFNTLEPNWGESSGNQGILIVSGLWWGRKGQMCNSVSLKMVDLDHMILTIQNHTRKNGAALGVYSVISSHWWDPQEPQMWELELVRWTYEEGLGLNWGCDSIILTIQIMVGKMWQCCLCRINLLAILAIAEGPAPLGAPRLSDAPM